MTRFQKYKRGQIILVNFNPSTGSELRGKHFAIVLTKKDSPGNGVLTVVPLSSKNKAYYLDVGNIVSKQIFPLLISQLEEFTRIFQDLDDNGLQYNEEDINQVTKNLNELKDIAEMYIKKNKRSYALVQNITTISKYKILPPTSKYDPLKKLIADDLILDLIESKLIELFVKDKSNKK